MKLYAAKVTLKNGDLLPPLTVIAEDDNHALARFIAYIDDHGHEDAKYSISELPVSELSFFGYEKADPETRVLQHVNIDWQKVLMEKLAVGSMDANDQ
ncbi:hypothetical protein FHS76_002010 [Ochrobactrum daejeonense]|uniref:Uncharacterized protein n=1 Tax=Brucella daejeonensis TaxID=659015 RepID=A0A7W9EMJ8_9HYPH|nr:hypothetical protein [Brucella daejeonensis]MBB5702135.1 hypothetical protein [Brucella daejeonensis]NKB80022.1 hypothetical protein [Brucella daejeonensis]